MGGAVGRFTLVGWGFIRESAVSEPDGDILITEEGPRKQVGDCYLPCMRAEPVATEVAAVPKSMIVPASRATGGSDTTKVCWSCESPVQSKWQGRRNR